LLYGGNAVLGHIALSEYADLLTMLTDLAGADTLMIPSVGPAYGLMMDQATILRDYDFPTAMLLPTNDPTTPAGIATAVRKFVERYGRPVVLYLKRDGAVDVPTVQRLMQDGLLSWIKYAIVREETTNDPFLRTLSDAIGTRLLVSGMGEQPAIPHLQAFGLVGFTSGCVCVAPGLSMRLLRAMQSGDFETAERLRATFRPLERLRDAISPTRVLHDALTLGGIADTGTISPPLSPVEESDRAAIAEATRELARQEERFAL
jgi:dihydrodipicolinate synthase/N-acetylneuraminate lyase